MALDAREVIEDFLQSHDLDFDRTDNNTFMVTLPGENKLHTHCALIVGDHSLSINAFVIRKPDTHEDAEIESGMIAPTAMPTRRPTQQMQWDQTVLLSVLVAAWCCLASRRHPLRLSRQQPQPVQAVPRTQWLAVRLLVL